MSNRFDQNPDEPYGKCRDCALSFDSKSAASEHMRDSFEAAKENGGNQGHAVSVTNPERAARISNHVAGEIQDAVDRALGELDRLVYAGDVSEVEIKTALRHHPDFQDTWEEEYMEDQG